MALAKRPGANQLLTDSNQLSVEQKAFINGSKEFAAPGEDGEASENGSKSVPVMIRVRPKLLKEIDDAAARLGLKRASFLLLSASEKLERMGRE